MNDLENYLHKLFDMLSNEVVGKTNFEYKNMWVDLDDCMVFWRNIIKNQIIWGAC